MTRTDGALHAHGSAIVLRPWQSADAPALSAIADDARIAANLRNRFPHPYTIDDAYAWIAICERASSAPLNFAIEADGRLAGGIGLERGDDVHADTIEIGYWLGVAFWGRGIATAAVMALTRYAFDEIGARRLQAPVFDWNAASARVLEKAGYTLDGRLREHVVKHGRVGDALLYARLRSDPDPVSAHGAAVRLVTRSA